MNPRDRVSHLVLGGTIDRLSEARRLLGGEPDRHVTVRVSGDGNQVVVSGAESEVAVEQLASLACPSCGTTLRPGRRARLTLEYDRGRGTLEGTVCDACAARIHTSMRLTR